MGEEEGLFALSGDVDIVTLSYRHMENRSLEMSIMPFLPGSAMSVLTWRSIREYARRRTNSFSLFSLGATPRQSKTPIDGKEVWAMLNDNVARLIYRETSPKSEICHALDCLWSVGVSSEGCGTPSHWVLPDGCYSLAVRVRGPWYVHLRKPALAPFRSPCQLGEEIVGIRFRPGVVPDAAVRSIRRKLRKGQTAAEVLATLQQVVQVETADPERRIDRMISVVREGGGRIALPAVAESVQLSPRHLERLCLDVVGLSPKAFARVTR
ncbi:MAG: hypothetical protein ABI806_27620, partial [Candidatus Solibacter sp.]